ncbi:MAG: hypothetical protein ACNS62_11635 [Candidatus Cyclobacteriaceae bacterium M3_2C_046]
MDNVSTIMDIWYILMWLGTAGFVLAGIFIFVFYWIKLGSLKDYKAKYDYVSKYEIKRMLYTVGSFSIAFAAFINTTYAATVAISPIWFFVRLFLSICFATLIIYITWLIFKYTYPARVNQKLLKYRYHPRVSTSGNKMKLLSEEEEDVHLEEGMQAEEDVFSVDYDVWVDQKTGETKIEKYPGHLQALKCNSCGFQTMKVVKEEVVTNPTRESTGQLIKHYRCSYCRSTRKKMFRVARIMESSDTFTLPKEMHFREDKKIEFIKLEFHIHEGRTKSYEFQNMKQLKDFLKEVQEEELLET